MDERTTEFLEYVQSGGQVETADWMPDEYRDRLIKFIEMHGNSELMREPGPADPTDGPQLDVATTMRKALPVLAATEKPVCCMEAGHVIGIVDREAVLRAIAEEGED